jgi:hypothetical protein
MLPDSWTAFVPSRASVASAGERETKMSDRRNLISDPHRPIRRDAPGQSVTIHLIGKLGAACIHERTLCFNVLELLPNDRAELSFPDLRKYGKNNSEFRRSAKRRVDLSRKPGFWIEQ